MDPDRWQRIEALFLRAVELDPAERRELLDEERERDPDAVLRVERLLANDAKAAGGFLDELESGAWARREDPMLGRELGVYRLVSRIAAGGMGVVYRAERTDGLFDHAVAVKLIRAEGATEAAIRRFDLERRALAALSHPNIARLHDGGTTDEGSPYLVMELVDGGPIDRSCDERRLSIDERLRLFATVCRAVHFAHQNLVVHRDLKPSNVLIDATGAPKLLDFGIARLLEGEPEERAATRTIARVLTPDYASPEQLTGGPVTTSIDVYSLGVVLYELLAGSRPFDLHSRSPIDWQRTITERAPDRPSEAAFRGRADGDEPGASPSEIAARRGTTPAGLRRRLAGDLDRIVLMALRKEPERRYASAQALAEDVERHLAGQPVLARVDSLAYRAVTFARRNRIEVSAAALVLVAIGVALVATRRSELRALAQAEHARIEAESFRGVAEFVMDTFLTSSLSLDEGRLGAARERVQLHAERVRLQHPEQPHLRANLVDALGHVALRLDDYSEAEELVREALAVRVETFGERSLEVALSLQSLGRLHLERGDLTEAAELFERALDLHRTLEPGTHTDVATAANDLAVCRRQLGDLDGAERLHREALDLRRAGGERTLAVAESLNNLAGIHLDRGELGPAREILSEALDIRRAVLSPRHPLTLQTTSNLAVPTWQSGEHDEAIALLEEAATGLRALRADGAEGLARVLSNLAAMQITSGELEPAGAHLAEAIAIEEQRLGAGHPSLAGLYAKLAWLQHGRGEDREARESWERVLELRREPSGSPLALAGALYSFGRFLVDVQDLDAASSAFAEAVAILRAEPASEELALGRAELALGECLAALGRAEDARGRLREAEALLEPYPVAAEERERGLRLLERLGGADE